MYRRYYLRLIFSDYFCYTTVFVIWLLLKIKNDQVELLRQNTEMAIVLQAIFLIQNYMVRRSEGECWLLCY
jgi:hypothetical protein